MDKKIEFLKELKDLLIKYNATIEFDCGDFSDLDGLYDEKIIARIDNEKIQLANGYEADADDLIKTIQKQNFKTI